MFENGEEIEVTSDRNLMLGLRNGYIIYFASQELKGDSEDVRSC